MRRFFPLVVLAVATACARPVTLNAGADYAINVVNPMPHAMIVYFDDGSGERLLGTVEANRTTRFVVAAGDPEVTIVARDEAQTHTVNRNVTLRAGQTVDVRLAG